MAGENELFITTDPNERFVRRHLERFLLSHEERQLAVRLLKDGVGFDNVFRIFSDRRGAGNTHHSGNQHQQGKLKGS